MAQKYGFFNSLLVNGIPDRKYNANDYSDNLAVVIGNGVLRSENDDLKVTASGLTVSVAAGRAWINGHYYLNDAVYSFPAVTAPTGGKRWDRVFLRCNKNINSRSITLVYQQGTAAATPTKPAPTRTGDIYDLVLADVYLDTNATTVTVTDTRGDSALCGWVYSVSGDGSFFTSLDNNFNSWFAGVRNDVATVTIFKQYIWRSVLSSATSTVQFNIPQYDSTGVSYIEVFVNGILRNETAHYSLSGNIITFSGTLTAGTEVVVKCYKSIDGTGIDSVADEITELQNRVDVIDSVAQYTYNATNNNDNLSLSQIAQAIYSGSYTSADVTAAADAFLSALGGNTWLAALPTDAHITINVVGKLGVSTPFAGSGTSLSRYKWFSLGQDAVSDKRIIFDFANAERMLIWCAGDTDNIIFYGTDMDIRNVHFQAKCNATGCAIEAFAGRYNYGTINVENAKIYISTTGKVILAENGTFINCDAYGSSSNTHALLFCPTTNSLVRVLGGTYRAYTASASSDVVSAVFYTYATETDAVAMAYNINCPAISVSAFYQKKLAIAYAGKTYINGVITTLASEGTYYEIVGAVSKNKQH